ncbi:MAG: hypothetical protein ACHQJ6_02645 [Candidatus Berkiellales bacterium]
MNLHWMIYSNTAAAVEKGWIDEREGVFAVLTTIHRAGAVVRKNL